MGRMKDMWIKMQENMSEEEEQALIDEQKIQEYIENCIEQAKIDKQGE